MSKPKLQKAVPETAADNAGCTALPDGELTERIRAGAPSAYPAVQELRRRHMPALRGYAMLCGRNTLAGNQLAVQAFDLATQEACRGIGPEGCWGRHLLTVLQRIGLTWAAGSRRARLEPGFAAWLDDNTDVAPPYPPDSPRPRLRATSPMLTGFQRLPEQTRGILWYAVVDDEPDATVATFVGVSPAMVPELRAKALDALRRAYIQAYLEDSGSRKCQGFRRIIEAASQPGDGRRSNDLALHLAECPGCARLTGELSRLAAGPRAVLAEGLLRWGGAAYAAGGPVRARHAAGPATIERWETGRAGLPVPHAAAGRRRRGGGTAGHGVRRPSRLAVLVAVAVAAVVIGTLLATGSGDPAPGGDHDRAGAEEPSRWEARPPAVLPTAAPSATAAPSPSPSKKPSASPSRTTPAPTTAAPAPQPPPPAPSKSTPPRPVPIAAGSGYTQVVNAASGLCLDIDGGVMQDRTDVLTAPCDGTPSQQWKLESIGLLRSSADPDYCLDSRGATDRGVGIWSCSSVNGRNGLNLLFIVDSAGVVRPRIAPDFALEPLGDSGGGTLDFDPADGDSDQRWTAGR
ncbi:ricin-type beta-trefoil lectin domain protein [Streptomyces sp. NPDC054847]